MRRALLSKLGTIFLLVSCQPGTVAVGAPGALPGRQAATLGAYRGINRAQVERELLVQLHRFTAGVDTLQLRAEYAAATESAAASLADWARRLVPDIGSREDVAGFSQTRIAVVPPGRSNISAGVSWGPVWGVTITSPARHLSETDVKQWAAMLTQLSLDERWRLVTYGVGRPIAERR